MTKESTINIQIGPQMLLMPWGNLLPNAIWCQVQVSRESSKLTNLLGILSRSGHVGKDRKVIIWVPTKWRL